MLRRPSLSSCHSCHSIFCPLLRPLASQFIRSHFFPAASYAPLSDSSFFPTTSSDKSTFSSVVPSGTSTSSPSLGKSRLPLVQRRSTVLQAITGDFSIMDEYHFPDARLKKKMDDPSKTPLLLVACGSFSPITFLHLRMFVMAADYVKHNTEFEMVGGYLSPVSDAYKKQGLAPAEHR